MKRFFDFLVSSIALLALLPIFFLLALLVRISIGTPILFIQKRSGLNGKAFNMIKFRSMTNTQDGDGSLLPDFERLTRFGQVLRATSLDELPELWNVLKGDMSLVGPRPLLMEYLPLYSPEQARRHNVRPGITGWAQVNGRNAISWDDRLKLDVWYVDHQSFWLDAKILLLTVMVVFQRHGINTNEETAMPLFRGDRRDDHL